MKLDSKKIFRQLIKLLNNKSIKVQKLSLFCIEKYKDLTTYKKIQQYTDKKTLYLKELKEIFKNNKSCIEEDILNNVNSSVVFNSTNLKSLQ